MDFLHNNLKEFISVYRPTIEKIRDIEDKAAISAINFKFAENLRHSIEHLAIGMEKAYKTPAEQKGSEYHIGLAIHDITNLASDACEHIAGKKLKEAEKHILKSISFGERKKAKELYKHAYYHYTQGRNKRTGNPDEANNHFLKTVESCVEGILSVKPISLYKWIMFLLALSGWATFLAKIFDLF